MPSAAKRSAIFILALIGAILSGVALYEHVALKSGFAAGPAFCNLGGSFNCEIIINSSWSTFLGIPLGSYGLAFYLILCILTSLGRDEKIISARAWSNILFLFCLCGFGFSLFLFLISKFVINGFCIICIATYVVNALLLIVTWLLNREEGLVSRFAHALTCLIEFFSNAFGFGRDRLARIMAQAFMLLVVLVCFGSSALGDFLFVKFVYPEEQIKERLRHCQSAEAVVLWNNSPKTKLELSFDSALKGDYRKGPADAKIQVVEFLDYECPACRFIYREMQPLINKLGNKIAVVFKNYPLDRSCNPGMLQDMHHNACFAAQFARCAGEQGKFWEVADYLFSLPALEQNIPNDTIRKEIQASIDTLGLDPQGMQECLDSPRQLDKIKTDIAHGDKLNLQGTPSIWVNGKFVKIPSSEALKAIFERILAQS